MPTEGVFCAALTIDINKLCGQTSMPEAVEYKHSGLVPKLEREFPERLKQAIGNRSVLSFARECGLSDSLVRKYLSGSLPGLDKVLVMARTAGVSVQWLATGEEVHTGRGVVRDTPTNDYALIPRYDVYAKAGADPVVGDASEVQRLAFYREWLRHEALEPDKLVLVTARGDSMEPAVGNGDLLLVDTSRPDIEDDGIYALRIDGQVFPKRLQRDWSGGLWVRSDNPHYQDQHIADEDYEALAIVGRVVWVGRRV